MTTYFDYDAYEYISFFQIMNWNVKMGMLMNVRTLEQILI